MFEISGVFAEKFHPLGYILRLPNSFTQYVNTEDGVRRFLDEEKPFRSIKVIDYTTKKNLTKQFLGES